MSYTIPTVSDIKTFFARDFPYGETEKEVMDADISKAIVEAGVNINESLWPTQEIFSLGYMYLTAHYLVMDLRASSQGLSGEFTWLQSSKSVGSVSEGTSFPQMILDNPYYAYLSKTNYGAKYLSMTLPLMVGNVVHVGGGVRP